MRKSFLICLTAILASMSIITSCAKNDTNEEVKGKEPVISFANDKNTFVVKKGKTITIKPIVENDENAMYSWISDGKLLGKEKNLTFSSEESGQVFITFKVLTDYGSDEKEIRIDVAELVPPKISLAVPKDGYVILANQELKLAPTVDAADESTFIWKTDGKEVSKEKTFTFKSDKTGSFKLSLNTENEDGKDFLEFDVHVKAPEDMPFSWIFEKTVYNITKGRTLNLMPFSIRNAFDAEYTWTVDGKEVQHGENPAYIFKSETTGQFEVSVTMKNSYNEFSQKLTVNVCEGAKQREATASSNKNWNKVYEFLPAPGQFVNEDYTAATMQQAIAYAEDRLKKELYVSLGGFGGYIVLGFDHSIVNDGGYNLQVCGNSFAGSSEPGIVWVMQDENGDGLPNDTWYELKGSEYGKPGTVQNYEITYYRPRTVQMPVAWTDNQGKSGSIDYLPGYHRQDSYYPSWVKEASYVLRGTYLKSRSAEVNPGYWSNDAFEWGYADNFSPIDRLTNDNNNEAGVNANHLRISDAVTFDGKPANLEFIDFIKVQTAVNAKAGWLGEISTEVFGARDYNLIKK